MVTLVGSGDQQPVSEGLAAGLRDELVDVGLADAADGVVRLGLNRPQVAVVVLGHQVNPGINALPARPLVPQPHPPQQRPIRRIVLKKPLADGLELVTLALGVSWVELRREIVETPHTSAM